MPQITKPSAVEVTCFSPMRITRKIINPGESIKITDPGAIDELGGDPGAANYTKMVFFDRADEITATYWSDGSNWIPGDEAPEKWLGVELARVLKAKKAKEAEAAKVAKKAKEAEAAKEAKKAKEAHAVHAAKK